MSFKSLDQILGVLESSWPQSFQQVLRCWSDIVGAAVAVQTRPVSVGRGVLWVATSSAAWAQTLTFERQRILQKLNLRLSSPLVDIRFSTAGWQRAINSNLAAENITPIIWRNHPSALMDIAASPSAIKSSESTQNNLQATFAHWAKATQERSNCLPLCPQCQCPTPPGELQRWALCSMCAAKQW